MSRIGPATDEVLYLGSFPAILDPGAFGAHYIAALVEVLDAPWSSSSEAHAAQGLLAGYLGLVDGELAEAALGSGDAVELSTVISTG